MKRDRSSKKERRAKKNTNSQINKEEEELVFEDPFVDEYEEEDVMEDTKTNVIDDENEEEDPKVQTWDPMERPLEEGETLNYDSSAYKMFHTLRPEWPSLSFDILKDNLGAKRTKFPLTAFMVTGTQADKAERNKLTVMKVSELHKTEHDEDSDADDDDDEMALDDDPVLESVEASHPGCTNRIRAMPQKSNVVATWADTGRVHIWDISEAIQQLSSKGGSSGRSWRPVPVFTFEGHPCEGYAMAWSSRKTGQLLTGDCRHHIYHWQPTGGSTWSIDKIPFKGHKDSVEDLQWSPSEDTVFASCSVDKTVRIWDTRCKKRPMLTCSDAHDTDVNVIAWNRLVEYLIVSGSDDGSFKIWDLRSFKSQAPAAYFQWYTQPVTSVSWHPDDDSVLAVASADSTISIWDMSVEADGDEAEMDFGDGARRKVPPQMLFLHQGCKDPKEIHFHPQLPGVIISTGSEGYNLFRPCNL